MDAHIEPQIIMREGKPAFAVIPWEEYQKLAAQNPRETDVWIPHEVVKANVIKGVSMIRAWREHLGMTQEELSKRAGMTQPALARLEKIDAKPRVATLKKIAAAMDISVEQIVD
ncbi:Prevent-host-death family protein [Candidatus Desulfarcum epimagneticum]|uniref:Prevent-host-death family protein n=1 Tax=uncultured Desulfobacteraceae bacterium TaxID=218296 RepID=A0A484HER1_9BACT|nr:Prevent-host-death family protein [uncultured Desulfobacteraceae bacterium]